jgi:hypothetical protein
VEELKR